MRTASTRGERRDELIIAKLVLAARRAVDADLERAVVIVPAAEVRAPPARQLVRNDAALEALKPRSGNRRRRRSPVCHEPPFGLGNRKPKTLLPTVQRIDAEGQTG